MTRQQIFYDIPEEWHGNRKLGLCPVCGKDKSLFNKLQKVYCSIECRDEYASRIMTWSGLRDKVIDKYGKICKHCGVNPQTLEAKRKQESKEKVKEWAKNHKAEVEIARKELLDRAEEFYQQAMDDNYVNERACPFDIKRIEFFSDGFQVDHVHAIVNEGDAWDINNLQVLCEDCHKKKTKQDMAKRTKGNQKIDALTGENEK